MPKSPSKPIRSAASPTFPLDIELASPPLAEAWLEIRWQLQSAFDPNLGIDPGLPYALGVFYSRIKERYGKRIELDTSRAPLELVPHLVTHRFHPIDSEWPLMQIGPGVATVNLRNPYSWPLFLEEAEYLRTHLLAAYEEHNFVVETLTLRYKNAEPFSSASSNLLSFLSSRLNIELRLPASVPGSSASSDMPTSCRLNLTFDLAAPKGTGTLVVGTGTRQEPKETLSEPGREEIVIWQIEIASGAADTPNLRDASEYRGWLDAAHIVAHDWFFALIEGKLRKQYSGVPK